MCDVDDFLIVLSIYYCRSGILQQASGYEQLLKMEQSTLSPLLNNICVLGECLQAPPMKDMSANRNLGESKQSYNQYVNMLSDFGRCF